MGRIIGIDYGRKRTGVAVTDPLQIFASPLTTVRTHEIEKYLEEYYRAEHIESFVVGYPLQMNNKPGKTVTDIDKFIKRLKKLFPGIPVHKVDERFTSGIALRTMIAGGVKMKDRQDKAMIDKISASIILQSFLDKMQKTKSGMQ